MPDIERFRISKYVLPNLFLAREVKRRQDLYRENFSWNSRLDLLVGQSSHIRMWGNSFESKKSAAQRKRVMRPKKHYYEKARKLSLFPNVENNIGRQGETRSGCP